MELSTPRLRLREFTPGDHVAVHAFAGDAEVTRYTDWGPNTPEDTAAFLDEVVRESRARPRSRFALAVVEGAALIGSVELRITGEAGELGYVLHRDRWGQGYATECAAAMLRLGFGELGLCRISAFCDPGNVASSRVLIKIGMRPGSRLRDHVQVRGRWRDRLIFAAVHSGSGSGPAVAERENSGRSV